MGLTISFDPFTQTQKPLPPVEPLIDTSTPQGVEEYKKRYGVSPKIIIGMMIVFMILFAAALVYSFMYPSRNYGYPYPYRRTAWFNIKL